MKTNLDKLVQTAIFDVFRAASSNNLKNEEYFYDSFGIRIDLKNHAYRAWNRLKADVVRRFEPALRQFFHAESGSGFTSGLYFYCNKEAKISKSFTLPARNSSNGFADLLVRAFQNGSPSPNLYNISIFTTLQGENFSITNRNRLAYFYKLDYAMFVLSMNCIALVDIKKAKFDANKFEELEGFNELKEESFIKYVSNLTNLEPESIHIFAYEPTLNEYTHNFQEYPIKQGKGYTSQIPDYALIENMPKTRKLYTIYNFRNGQTFTYSIKDFAFRLAAKIKKDLKIDIEGKRLYERIRTQFKRAEDKDFVEIYVKETGNTYIFAPFMSKDEDKKEFQNKVNTHQCKLHGVSGYVKKADRPKVELARLIESTRYIKPENTLTNQDIDDLHLKVLHHKNSKQLNNMIKPTTEFIYGGVPKDEDTNERNNKKHLPAFFLYEIDDYGEEVQKSLLEKALKSPYKDSIFFATWSGNKSLHITVWIDPCYRALAATNYKAYWKQTAEKVFGTWECFDTQCASIAHPARIPNGIRYLEKENTYTIQSCWHLNKTPNGIHLDCLAEENKKLLPRPLKVKQELTDWQKIDLRRGDAGRLVYDVVHYNLLNKGEEYFKGLMYLFNLNVSKDFIQEHYFSKVKTTHPTSLGLLTLDDYWNTYKKTV